MISRIACLVVGYFFGCFLTAEVVSRCLSGCSVFEIGTGNPGMANVAAQLGFKAAAITLMGDLLKVAAACAFARYVLAPMLGMGALSATVGLSAAAGDGANLASQLSACLSKVSAPAGWLLATLAQASDIGMMPSGASGAVAGTGMGSDAACGQLAVLYAGVGATLGHVLPFWHRFRGGKGVATTCAAVILAAPVPGFTSLLIGLLVVLLTRQLCFGGVAIPGAFIVMRLVLGTSGEMLFLSAAFLVVAILCHGGPCLRALRGEEPQTDLLVRFRR